ncbi:hydroxymethylglutaryl-CoA reductase [Pseudoclavibacter chungangensis]|uniref:Hydroxymethylglutaryl-CoA reductase n=1 Tax=Pseudoclavibacter chungangensis TaxID=587635 RepID=A0A7J5BVR9_9MICO|nr:hydroxymethylglutaryl-CoA reductase [Pseudoclavibacter chungangensis]KAB1657953.1 hydroxymethylglutaryl-CoA reductase [Pseudoclavibacter chungangensis]NYJ65893.1 hydroxymethylglutaryl-CoA reductase (NADPH) [Pseudoclavibacter chungangensis]
MTHDETTTVTAIPTRWVGPIRVSGNAVTGEISVPLATYETPLWPSVGRGAKVSRLVEGGIAVTILGERMTRSVLFTAPDAASAHTAALAIHEREAELHEAVAGTSRFAKLVEVHPEIVGNLLFVRFALQTGDASGHNMVTRAADALMDRILSWGLPVEYGSISGNYCSDKKATAVNGILGRGRSAVADILIPHEIVERVLHTSAERIVDLVVRKNLVGSTIAGALRSANAHYANMLLAFYLATGQDAANIVEGSQGITYAETRPEGLYFSCTLPHLIVGTVGNGKHLAHTQEALERLGCEAEREPGANARRLAALIAASVLCGELSLLAAQTNPGELMAAHVAFERTGTEQS